MTKQCIDCGERKPADQFYRMHKGNEARQSRCKPCDNRKRTGNFKRDESGARRTVVERTIDGLLIMKKVAR